MLEERSPITESVWGGKFRSMPNKVTMAGIIAEKSMERVT